MTKKPVLIVGISGVTCGGKTTLASELKQILPNCKIISQDDYFLDVDDPRHVWISELDHINFDIITSLDMEKMYKDIQAEIKNKTVISHDKKSLKKFELPEIDVLIIEGFCIFNYKPLVPLFALKYYLTLDREECFKRRIQRVYEPPDCPGYFENCVWPEHIKQLQEVQKEVTGVTYFNEHSKDILQKVLDDLNESL